MIKECVICGSTFKCLPSDKKVTCSDNCRKERARRAATGRQIKWSPEAKARLKEKGYYIANFRFAAIGTRNSPNTGPFETNIRALIWTIKSPEGIQFEVRNLNLWIRNNLDILPGTPEQARAGFMQMKRSMECKTKKKVKQWKGWRLVGWRKPEE